MKKLYAILFVVLFAGVVMAGLSRTDTSISMDKDKVETLTKFAGTDNIAPNATAIICDGTYCKSFIKQENLIQVEWITEQGTYTKEELIQQRDEFVKARLETYADVIKQRASTATEVAGEGTITITGR